jgi:exopolysaccharide biosynthesis predicted pyruvyltransferase EpsI
MQLDNLRKDPAFAAMLATVKEITSGKQVIYTPNVGNWGDGLIHKGNVQFLQTNRIPHTSLTRGRVDRIRESLTGTGIRLNGTVLLAGGGGSWCQQWHGARDFVARNAAMFDHVIVLPSTFELEPLPSPADNITYFRRDNFHSQAAAPNSLFCHDAAFYLDVPTPGNEPVIEEGYFFREDREQNDLAVKPANNLDISLLGTDSKKITPFFQILSSYKSIHTDRMHVAIAGSMLGRQVTLYPGSYFKSVDVYRSSIEPNYTNTRLLEWTEARA